MITKCICPITWKSFTHDHLATLKEINWWIQVHNLGFFKYWRSLLSHLSGSKPCASVGTLSWIDFELSSEHDVVLQFIAKYLSISEGCLQCHWGVGCLDLNLLYALIAFSRNFWGEDGRYTNCVTVKRWKESREIYHSSCIYCPQYHLKGLTGNIFSF